MERVSKYEFALYAVMVVLQYNIVSVWQCRGQRVRPIVVDPGLYLARRTQIFHATEKRPTPDAFKIFTGEVDFATFLLLLCFVPRAFYLVKCLLKDIVPKTLSPTCLQVPLGSS